MTIRPAAGADADALGVLVSQLGYPAESDEMPDRLARMTAGEAVIALVAELGGRVVGFVSAHLLSTIHSSVPVAYLTALVVAEDARGHGIGAALVRRAEDWARSRGAKRIAVTSATHRTAAHEFYDRLGYARTGVRFGRQLAES